MNIFILENVLTNELKQEDYQQPDWSHLLVIWLIQRPCQQKQYFVSSSGVWRFPYLLLGHYYSPNLLRIFPIWQRAYGGCDRSAGDALCSRASDLTSYFCRGPCFLWPCSVFPLEFWFWILFVITTLHILSASLFSPYVLMWRLKLSFLLNFKW